MTGGMEDPKHDEGQEGSTAPQEPSLPQEAVSVETAELPDLSESASEQASLDDREILDLNKRFAAVRRSVGALEKVLLQGPRKYSRRDLADQQDIPERLTSVYWRSLGFTPVDEDTVVFTEEDAYAIGDLAAITAAVSEAPSSLTKGQRTNLEAAADYLAAAPSVVRVARGLPVGGDLSMLERPRGFAHPEQVQDLAARWGLGGSVDRLAHALAG